MGMIIQVQNLVKRYGDVVAVDNLSFEVEQGGIFGLLGPNGAGKTTTKEAVAKVLGTRFLVFKNHANYSGRYGYLLP